MSYRIDRTPRPVRFRFGHSLGLPFRRFISAGGSDAVYEGASPTTGGVGPPGGSSTLVGRSCVGLPRRCCHCQGGRR